MTLLQGFGTIADLFSVVAAILSLQTWRVVVQQKKNKRERLEAYLANERPGKRGDGDQGARGLIHLMDELHLSEDELLEAAFDSKHIETLRSTKEDGIAKFLLLKYKPA